MSKPLRGQYLLRNDGTLARARRPIWESHHMFSFMFFMHCSCLIKVELKYIFEILVVYCFNYWSSLPVLSIILIKLAFGSTQIGNPIGCPVWCTMFSIDFFYFKYCNEFFGYYFLKKKTIMGLQILLKPITEWF